MRSDAMPSRDAIMACLDRIQDPCSVASGRAMGLIGMGLVRDVAIGEDGAVHVRLRLTSPACYMMPFFESEARREVGAVPGVTSVTVEPDEGLDWTPEFIAPHLRRQREVDISMLVARENA